jgi:hypothetical protein
MKFLREDWFEAARKLMGDNDDLKAATSGANFAVQQLVTEAPGGEIRHYFKAEDGNFQFALGELDAPDATLTATYANAAAMNKGELDAMSAFGSGKMLVTGNLAVLMQHQAVLTQMNKAFEELRAETEYEA